MHIAVDTLGNLLALRVTPASIQDCEQVAQIVEDIQVVQVVTGNSVELLYADGGYSGENAAKAAQEQGVRLQIIKVPDAVRGFVVLPKQWIVERSFASSCRHKREDTVPSVGQRL